MDYRIPLLFIGGCAAGLYGASVGGGGLFSLPLLLLVGLPPHLALGTQRLSAVFLEFFSSLRFYTAKKLNIRLAVIFSFFAIIGAVLGVSIVVRISSKSLDLVIGILLMIVTLVLANKDKLTSRKSTMHKDNLRLLLPTSILLGFYNGFFGAGFGAVSVIALSLFGFSFVEGAAISRVIGFAASSAAAIIFGLHHYINYELALSLGLGFAVGSWIGVGLALKKGENYVKVLLYVVIAASLIKILFDFIH